MRVESGQMSGRRARDHGTLCRRGPWASHGNIGIKLAVSFMGICRIATPMYDRMRTRTNLAYQIGDNCQSSSSGCATPLPSQ